jgi:hypothetical protein
MTPFKLYKKNYYENKIKGGKTAGTWRQIVTPIVMKWSARSEARKWLGFFQHVERKKSKGPRFSSYAEEGGEAAVHIGTLRVGQWPGWHRKASLIFTYSRFMSDMQFVYSMH